ncbi:MAG: MTAP family purine nucleoside phosphorylase [Chloroflexi bacterium]|nr:MTAP family purine nucleoside phosphorylase [Chloroflexota bacterium]
MSTAIIAGTDIYRIPGLTFNTETIQTPYGDAIVNIGQGAYNDLFFLPRHGPRHTIPPHRINYRAHIKALHMLGVQSILAAYAVGSIQPDIPPKSLVLLDDFLDFTSDRPFTFYEGGDTGLAHTIMSQPYCPTLSQRLRELAPEFDLELRPTGTYVCTNGPRFETPGEIRMYRQLGGDVVGMTGAQEATLARELGMHFAAVALSINWAAGIESTIRIVNEGQEAIRARLLSLFLKVLTTPSDFHCPCQQSVLFTHRPAVGFNDAAGK